MEKSKKVSVQSRRECCGAPCIMIDEERGNDFLETIDTVEGHLRMAFWVMRAQEKSEDGDSWYWRESREIVRALLGDLKAGRIFKFRDVKAVRADREDALLK